MPHWKFSLHQKKMKTALIYATNHGTTEKVANMISKSLDGDIKLFNLKNTTPQDLSSYDSIIIGGSIHAGKIQKKVEEFCNKNIAILLQKRVALFICAMNVPEYQKELSDAFPKLLFNHAIAKKVAGGEFLFENMNFIEKMIVKGITGVKESVYKIDEESVADLCSALKS